ncbi:hypothetical protein [Allobranchiibius sp. GilTou73]|uniref:hypothetical protein n=1 Tax=Allobranchiibius sp. GilTou73 TaxID=2904523 RepID=UPI001F46560A|nr:hypothetical protein [Allobranchiibius sp. GilTou73]UIJ35818.1 hypothetical protein LVQ62_05400 [Allobranchiibius sp. GilTou73]
MRLPASAAPLSARMLLAGFDRLVRSNLRSVSVRGTLPPAPVIWAGNHHSWWDAFVASSVLRGEHHDATLVMDAENLASFGFLKPLGLVPSDQPRAGLTALRGAARSSSSPRANCSDPARCALCTAEPAGTPSTRRRRSCPSH